MSGPAGDDPWGGPTGSRLDKDFADLILRTVDSGQRLLLAELAFHADGNAPTRNDRFRKLWDLQEKVEGMIDRESKRRFAKGKQARQGDAEREPWEQETDGASSDDDDDD